MKKIIIFLFLIAFLSCKMERKEKSIKGQDKIEVIKKKYPVVDIDVAFLYGVWAENEDENALFEIDKDTLRYVEFYEKPYLYSAKNNRLIIKDVNSEQISNDKILKLNKDSLILETDNNEVIRLYKRLE